MTVLKRQEYERRSLLRSKWNAVRTYTNDFIFYAQGSPANSNIIVDIITSDIRSHLASETYTHVITLWDSMSHALFWQAHYFCCDFVWRGRLYNHVNHTRCMSDKHVWRSGGKSWAWQMRKFSLFLLVFEMSWETRTSMFTRICELQQSVQRAVPS